MYNTMRLKRSKGQAARLVAKTVQVVVIIVEAFTTTGDHLIILLGETVDTLHIRGSPDQMIDVLTRPEIISDIQASSETDRRE